MTTSGVTTFGTNLEAIDVITEAFERCGRDASELSANDIDSARRSLNYLFTEWSNKGPNLFAVDLLRYPLTEDVSSITLPANTVSILRNQAYVRYTSGGTSTDLVISAMSRAEYAALPNKAQTGTYPTQYYLERTETPVIYLWPVPDNSDRELWFYRMRMIQDVGDFPNTLDVANRWVEAVAAGLAARLAVKFAPDRLPILEPQAAKQYDVAAGEDTERVPLTITPDQMTVGWR